MTVNKAGVSCSFSRDGPYSGDIKQLRSSANMRKMSSPAVVSSAVYSDDSQSTLSDDRLSPLSFAVMASRHSSRRQQPSRASFSTLDQLPTAPAAPPKTSSPTPKSGIPRPSSTSKLPLQRKSVVALQLNFFFWLPTLLLF